MKEDLLLKVAEQFYFKGLIPDKPVAYKKIVCSLIIDVTVWMGYLFFFLFNFVEKSLPNRSRVNGCSIPN